MFDLATSPHQAFLSCAEMGGTLGGTNSSAVSIDNPPVGILIANNDHLSIATGLALSPSPFRGTPPVLFFCLS